MANTLYKKSILPIVGSNKMWQMNYIIQIFPILLIQLYLSFAFLLFAFGPWPWPINNHWELYTFLIFAQLALLMGYLKALKNKPAIYIGKWSWEKLFKIGFLLNIFWIIPNLNNRLKLENFDPFVLLSMFQLGLSDPGAAYKIRQGEEIVGGSPIVILTILAAPFLQLLVPIGITYWHKLNWKRKALFVVFILIDLSSWIAAGTNQGIAELMLIIPFFIIAGSPMIINRIFSRRNLFLVVFSVVFLISFVSFFSKGMEGRLGKKIPLINVGAGISANESNVIFNLFDDQRGIIMLCSYLTQGYYGLSLSLEQPFVWCYGFGHTYYLTRWYKKIDPSINIDMLNYPGRVETQTGWSATLRYVSIYPWLASDVTFFGAIIVMFLLGYLFSKVWQDILWCKNPIALALSGILFLILMYIPLNNRLGFATTGIAFWVLFIWWARTRREI